MDRSSFARLATTLLLLGGCVSEGAAPEPQLESVRVTYLEVRYDLDAPVFVNNRVPVTFGLTATSSPGELATQQVAVSFSFLEADPADPTNPRGCASSAMNIEVIGDGEEHLFSGFVWPTTLCEEIAGHPVYLHVEFDGGPEAETGVDAPSVSFSPEEASASLNQLCRAPDDSRGCAYLMNLEGMPSDIDVRHAAMTTSSSVTALPAAASGAETPVPALVVTSTLVVNGRDPYVTGTAPEDVPADLEARVPGITEDLRFGLEPGELGRITEMPGRAVLRYEIAPTGSTEGFLPVAMASVDAEPTAPHVAEAVIDHLLPGTANMFTHELFLEGEALAALSPEGAWADVEELDVRGCFVAEFAQSGNAGDGGPDDCQVVPVVLVRDAGDSTASSFGFDAELSRSIGGRVLSLDASFSTRNHLGLDGASTRTEGAVEIHGNIGRSFEVTIARAVASAALGREAGASYEVSVDAFGRSLLSRSLSAESIDHDEDFSFGRSFRIASLGYGFGPVRIGISFELGGEVGIETGDSLTAASGAACNELLGTSDTITACGSVSRQVTPRFAFTARIEGGIDVGIARAGVAADLRIVQTDFPLTALLAFGVRDDGHVLVRGDVDLNVGMTLIQGQVAIVGRVGIRRFSRSLRVNLFSFSSPRISQTLLDRSLALEVLE